ncbi:GGDEF domain-containing protein [Rhizobium sp. C4]|uniref:GGDEF domain-containing protein n=1 Tax=Rhizobium sp. C4 TaxID=1349800 RepID=UPI001E4425D0|nr:GGDEF domain-containing protein [Rhizobium sp. C4]MCD2173739.1 GGDEF domain-containing protein [Rhizobium sp. C4]
MNLVSVPTVTLCIIIVMLTIGMAMAAIWRHDRKEIAAGFWSLSFIVGGASGLMAAVMTAASGGGIVAATFFNALSYALSWSGYRAFGKRKVYPSFIIALPTAILFIHLMFPALRENANNAIVLQSVFVTVMSIANAYAIYFGKGNSELSLTKLLAGFFVLHALFHGVNMIVTWTDPSPIVGGRIISPWFKVFILEAFFNVIVIATSSLLLIKERSEQRHRIASETDMLTGVANRRAFVQRTEIALKTAKEEAALAVVDLDHFKSINDQFGHQAGDRALVEFARTVKNCLPKDVLFGRIGGEEFAVFIPETPERSAFALLEDVRGAVETAQIQSQGRPLKLTVSVGCATIAKAGVNFDNLVAAADCALYAAKEEGRNRVAMFSPSMRLLKVLDQDGEKRIGLAEQRVSRRVTRIHNAVKSGS